MPVDYTILLLFGASNGCLAEVEVSGPGRSFGDKTQWLWIEDGSVSTLTLIGGGDPSTRVFDRAVLSFDGAQGELQWTGGRRDALTLDPARALRPEFERLVHQHLN